MAKDRRTVITGIGALCSLGIGVDEIWKNLLSAKTNIVKFNDYRLGEYSESFSVHKIAGFDINHFGLSNQLLDEMLSWKSGEEVIDLYYLLAAIKMALIDSRMECAGATDVGLVLTHENPGIEQFYSNILAETYSLHKQGKEISPTQYMDILNERLGANVNDLQTFMFLYYVARIFQVHGYSIFINNSCASGLYAIEAADQAIKRGINRAVIVASSEHPAIYKYLWFKKLKFLSTDSIIRPFDLHRNGFICGEGGTALILEDYDSAMERKAPIYAEYKGGGFFLEGWKRTLPTIHPDGREFAIRRALAVSQIDASQIDAINAHGLGSQVLDQIEAMAIDRVFNKNNTPPPVSAFKPYFGHTLGNAALLETTIMLLCMKYSTLPPILNLSKFDSRIKINLASEKITRSFETVLKFVWGFGGYNAAAIFKRI